MRFRLADLYRLAGITLCSFFLAYRFPPIGGASSVTSIFNNLLLFSFLIGFSINRALERRKTIYNGIEIELSRLRRVYNFCDRVSDQDWGRKMHQALLTYHHQVGEDLFAYKKALDDYRVITKLVYGFEPRTRKDEILFADLLHVTRDIALERRPLERALGSRLWGYSWAVMLIIIASVFALLLANRGQGMTHWSVGLTMTGILAVMDLLRSTDRLSKEEIERLQRLYRENVPE